MNLNANEKLVETAEEGKHPNVRVWETKSGRSLTIIATKFEKIESVSFSFDSGYIALFCKDNHNRTLILI